MHVDPSFIKLNDPPQYFKRIKRNIIARLFTQSNMDYAISLKKKTCLEKKDKKEKILRCDKLKNIQT